MSSTNSIDEDEPLDPVMERVRKKMVRLLVISIGIMVVGLMAVLGAIVYKISNPKQNEEAAVPAEAKDQAIATNVELAENIDVILPKGAIILSTSLTENRLLITVQLADGSPEFRLVDLVSGKVTSIQVEN